MVAHGRLHVVHRGVYAVGHTAVGPCPLRAALNLLLVQQLGRDFEPLVLNQPAHQRFPRILLGIVLRPVHVPGQAKRD